MYLVASLAKMVAFAGGCGGSTHTTTSSSSYLFSDNNIITTSSRQVSRREFVDFSDRLISGCNPCSLFEDDCVLYCRAFWSNITKITCIALDAAVFAQRKAPAASAHSCCATQRLKYIHLCVSRRYWLLHPVHRVICLSVLCLRFTGRAKKVTPRKNFISLKL